MVLTTAHPATANGGLQRMNAAVIGAIVGEVRPRLFGFRAGVVDKGALVGRPFPILDFDPIESVRGLLFDKLVRCFGVTAGFMLVGLAKGSFMGRPQPAGRTN